MNDNFAPICCLCGHPVQGGHAQGRTKGDLGAWEWWCSPSCPKPPDDQRGAGRSSSQESAADRAEVAGERPTAQSAEVASADCGRPTPEYRMLFELMQEVRRERDDLKGELARAATVARDIHQAIKRGKRTQDHGLIGNLRCILDHVLPDPTTSVRGNGTAKWVKPKRAPRRL